MFFTYISVIPITVLSGWKLHCDWPIHPLLKPDVGDVLDLGISRRFTAPSLYKNIFWATQSYN